MNPRLGIFLAKDPWSGDALQPGSMNGWGYAVDNPIIYTDPTGRFRICTPPFNVSSRLKADLLIKTTGTAGERLFKLFEDDFSECDAWLCAGLTAEDRLDFVLDYTQGIRPGVPSPGFPAQFRIDFGGDEGLAEELRDSHHYQVWGSATNQPGHFLTAVALAYRGPGILGGMLFRPDQDDEPSLDAKDRIALGLIVGHEILPDNIADPYHAAQLQFLSASADDIRLFLSALAAETGGDLTTRDNYFWQILESDSDYDEPRRVGNSIEDLRLSAKGWNFGKWVLNNRDVSHIIEGAWLRNNLGQ